MNSELKKVAFASGVMLAAFGVIAEEALVRVNLIDGGVRTERVALMAVSPSHVRFTYPRERIAADVASIDVVPDFMKAQKGDEGYWIDARGAYGRFEQEAGAYENDRAGWMPIFGLKRGDTLWYGQVMGWRCDYHFHAEAKDGRYEAFPRFMVKELRAYYPVYQDIVVDFHRLDGVAANYVGYAKAYRKYQFANAGIKMAKDRAKTNPVTDYLLESFVIRISQHCRKQVLKDRTLRMTRQNEQPLLVHMPFLIWRQYIARGSWSQQVAISSRRGNGCMIMPSLGRSFSSSAPNLKRDVSIFAEAPFDSSHSSCMRVI